MLISGAEVSEISVKSEALHAADVTIVADKSVREARFDGAVCAS
jgi:hypothetical protein